LNQLVSSLIPRFNDVVILQREDGYWNATAMCQADGKRWPNYCQNQSTGEFIDALSTSAGIPTDLLVQTVITGPNELRGTWVHRRVALDLARWCSPTFAVRVNYWVDQLLTTGYVSVVQAPQVRRPGPSGLAPRSRSTVPPAPRCSQELVGRPGGRRAEGAGPPAAGDNPPVKLGGHTVLRAIQPRTRFPTPNSRRRVLVAEGQRLTTSAGLASRAAFHPRGTATPTLPPMRTAVPAGPRPGETSPSPPPHTGRKGNPACPVAVESVALVPSPGR
jgi:hypothetical protein